MGESGRTIGDAQRQQGLNSILTPKLLLKKRIKHSLIPKVYRRNLICLKFTSKSDVGMRRELSPCCLCASPMVRPDSGSGSEMCWNVEQPIQRPVHGSLELREVDQL